MSKGVRCQCGKTYAWKPELAGRKARCKCGQTVRFGALAESAPPPIPPIPPPPPPPADDDPFSAMDDLMTQEAAASSTAVAAPPLPRVQSAPAYSPPTPPRRMASSSVKKAADPAAAKVSLRKAVGFLALGLVLMAQSIIWPMIQVMQHEPQISVSFKMMLVSVFMTGLACFLLADPSLREGGENETPKGKLIRTAVVVICSVGVTALVYGFFRSHGYEFK